MAHVTRMTRGLPFPRLLFLVCLVGCIVFLGPWLSARDVEGEEEEAILRRALAAGGEAEEGLSFRLSMKEMFRTVTSQEEALNLFVAAQNPPSCANARFLLVDDITTVSGFGFSALSLFGIFTQGVLEGRVVVHASSVLPEGQVRWAWCKHPPYSPACYFKPWSSCEKELAALLLEAPYHGLAANVPTWVPRVGLPESDARRKLPSSRGSERIVLWRSMLPGGAPRDEGFYWLEHSGLGDGLGLSRFAWYGVWSSILLAPNEELQSWADGYLAQNGIIGQRGNANGMSTRPFIVAHVRHGWKGTEQALVSTQSFLPAIRKMAQCIGTTNVFLVTETEDVVKELMASSNGLNIFTINYTRPGADLWNTELRHKYHVSDAQAEVLLDDICVASARALAVSVRACGLVGSIHSAWAKLTAAVMYGYHKQASPIMSLAPGWAASNAYTGHEANLLTYNPASPGWTCPCGPCAH